ncbi:Protein of unknown function [Pyronema omphalodes CBS 100304]|uniref:Uncharacterized protein n=1 Tax=Pyronema omphalodes (strain CBS 100304) TaxID=1076935 RepID=U4LPS4_PYROM|nr:Protein of unknown function [Pyronema omphalodes CBS 100304]
MCSEITRVIMDFSISNHTLWIKQLRAIILPK